VLTGAGSENLDESDPRGEVVRAYAPYALIVVIFSVAQIPAVKDWLAEATQTYDWPFLHVLGPDGDPVGGNVFSRPVVASDGTLVLLAGVCAAVVLGVHARVAVRKWAATVHELRFAILTVTSVLALAHVMNLSGQAATIGHFVAAVGAGLAFHSTLQLTAACESGLSPAR
jgi:lactate permease